MAMRALGSTEVWAERVEGVVNGEEGMGVKSEDRNPKSETNPNPDGGTYG
jgi:hypothetical protein